jgi:osmotically-inducible protein OsmY
MKTNRQLESEVLDELEWEPSVKAAEIGVAVDDGVVTLTGFVDSYAEKLAAEDAVKRVTDVRGVANELVVRLPALRERTDTDLARAAINALEWDVFVPFDSVKVTLENGWVTLDGQVERQFQRQAAENAVCHLAGVKGVRNLISIKSKATAMEIQADIEKALKRSAEVDAKRISVETPRTGKVILRGSVRSFAERQEAERVAWAAPGITDVDNQILIEL